MNKVLMCLISLPKTIWTNFRYLPIKQAFKFPLAVAYDTSVKCMGGAILLNCQVRPLMIRIGFHEVPACNRMKTKITVKGTIRFKGEAHIGNGAKFFVAKNAELVLGSDFKISANTSILCYRKIEFGKNIQLSWDCLVMDSDTHNIYDIGGNRCNYDKPVVFGENIWIGCRCTILKGSNIPDNCVIGAGSLITGQELEEGTIIAGNPAKSIKKIGGWHL